MKKAKWLVCLLAACVLACGAAFAEVLTPGVQCLLDVTAAAALDDDGQLTAVSMDEPLDPDFVYRLFTRGQQDGEALGLSAALLMDPQQQAAWLAANIAAAPGDLAGILWIEEELPRVSLVVDATDESEAGDAAIVFGRVQVAGEDTGLLVRADLRRDASAACGWRLERFAADAAGQESAADALFTSSMIEYVSPELGFSVQYPALFADVAEETGSGISGWLADKSAAFYVDVTLPEHRAGETVESIAAGLREAHGDLTLEVNEASGMLLASWQEGSTMVRRGYYVTEDVLCLARITWDVQKHPELAELSEYMMNSLSVDALGVG